MYSTCVYFQTVEYFSESSPCVMNNFSIHLHTNGFPCNPSLKGCNHIDKSQWLFPPTRWPSHHHLTQYALLPACFPVSIGLISLCSRLDPVVGHQVAAWHRIAHFSTPHLLANKLDCSTVLACWPMIAVRRLCSETVQQSTWRLSPITKNIKDTQHIVFFFNPDIWSKSQPHK